MKNTMVTCVLAFVLFLITGCDEHETQQDKTRALLVKGGTWSIQSVTDDGNDETAAYPNMTLVFSPTDFTTTNGGKVWPANGAWMFEEGSAMSIFRDDGVGITITGLTEKTLTLSFQWNETDPGMIRYDAPEFRFSFVRR